MRRTGIEGTFLEAIKSIYDNADITLSAGGRYGGHYKVATGITQGPPLARHYLAFILMVLLDILKRRIRM